MLSGVHATPAVHAVHAPSKHTAFVLPLAVHAAPFGTLPTAEHEGEPPEHDVIPVWHSLPPGLHDTPCAHAMHPPSLQT